MTAVTREQLTSFGLVLPCPTALYILMYPGFTLRGYVWGGLLLRRLHNLVYLLSETGGGGGNTDVGSVAGGACGGLLTWYVSVSHMRYTFVASNGGRRRL